MCQIRSRIEESWCTVYICKIYPCELVMQLSQYCTHLGKLVTEVSVLRTVLGTFCFLRTISKHCKPTNHRRSRFYRRRCRRVDPEKKGKRDTQRGRQPTNLENTCNSKGTNNTPTSTWTTSRCMMNQTKKEKETLIFCT